MTKAATTEELASIHKSIADTIVEDLSLQAPKIEDDDDNETKKLKLSVMDTVLKLRHDARSHAITFLKNNGITAARGNAELDALRQALANKGKGTPTSKLGITPAALEEAAELFGQRIQ